MAEGSDARAWEELIPDALGLIFRNLPLQEILTVIPRVCKSWSRVVLGPYCWQEIDIDEWSQHCKPEQLNKMLHMLIDRSCGSFRRLSVSGLHTESMFTLIADQYCWFPSEVLVRSKRLDLSLSDPDHYALIASDSFVKVKASHSRFRFLL
ncbi:hypothetical protein ZIOFF_039921 [Zingiber officinale]|uniref:F-box domain-containing protein n=1 Tax=Zingiber officinale TaxID=94328 RepID=A0A8J5GA85_ZINOF|nr:hypothetical protein ZIOFF_039921 [Zingiber officinale]